MIPALGIVISMYLIARYFEMAASKKTGFKIILYVLAAITLIIMLTNFAGSPQSTYPSGQ